MDRLGETKPLKFKEVSDGLRRGIVAGTWARGDRLPSEQQLIQSSGYSLNTVRRAIDELESEELVERRQGAGTFVTMHANRPARHRYTVGLMLPDISEYFPRVLQGVEAALAQPGIGLQVASYGYDQEREDRSIEKLYDSGVDGLLLVPTLSGLPEPGERVRELMSLPVPVVLLERQLASLGAADASEYVCSDHEGGAYDAVRHFSRLGHTRIALLLRSRSATAEGVLRGYLQASEDLRLPRVLHREAERAEWLGTRAGDMLDLILEEGMTAAVVFGDREAMLLAGAAARRGVSVPNDLAIISYDDETADVADVPLTAVSPPKHRIGRMAAQVLLRRMMEGDESPVHQIRIRPRLVVRESCGATGLRAS